MKKKGHICFIVAGLLFLIAALSLIGYNLGESFKAGEASNKALYSIQQQLKEAEEVQEALCAENEVVFFQEKEACVEETGKSVVEESSPVEAPQWEPDPDREMPVMEAEGQRYIGVLSILGLGLELPVQEDWDYPKLRVSPCRYKGSIYRDDMIIAAHNYEEHFGKLHTMKAGDKLTFTDVDGIVFSYEIREIELLSGTAVEEMEAGEWDLTLFTCTYGGEKRVTVRCEKSTI